VRFAYNRGFDARTPRWIINTVEALAAEIEEAWHEHFPDSQRQPKRPSLGRSGRGYFCRSADRWSRRHDASAFARRMSLNSFGHVFRFTTWGESHGPAIGAVVDGCPPGLSLSEDDLQPFLDARRPGQSRFTTQRQEPDRVRILSGTFEGRTTGTPISLMIDNVDQRSKDYSEVASAYRPGHADYAYDAKYGFRDYRGGGRSSARETASRVAAGGVARLVIPEVTITAWVEAIGGDAIDPGNFDLAEIGNNPFFCPDATAAARWERLVDDARKSGSSLGAVIACQAIGVPPGWGAPLYAKLDAELASACMGINAVKGVEIGDGFGAATLTGEQNADAMRPGDNATGGPHFLSNHAGGIAGGISTGQPVTLRVAFKPTSSILTPVPTITRDGDATEIMTKGRHDPCVGIRGAPVVEAMVALVLADQKLLNRAQNGCISH
jgi:chorismate synthase